MLNQKTLITRLDNRKKSLNRYIKLNSKNKVAWILVEIERLEYQLELIAVSDLVQNQVTRELIVGNEQLSVYYCPDLYRQKFCLVTSDGETFFNTEKQAIDAWFRECSKLKILMASNKKDIFTKMAEKQQSTEKSIVETPKLKVDDQITLIWNNHSINLTVIKRYNDNYISLALSKLKILIPPSWSLSRFIHIKLYKEALLDMPKMILKPLGNNTFKIHDHITLSDYLVERLQGLIEFNHDLIDDTAQVAA